MPIYALHLRSFLIAQLSTLPILWYCVKISLFNVKIKILRQLYKLSYSFLLSVEKADIVFIKKAFF